MFKKILLSTLISLITTFVVFEAASWYHFGDIPTTIVLIRMIGFFLAVCAILFGIISLVIKKKN